MSSVQDKAELPIITKRTLNLSGDSLVVSLPREWIRQKGLKKGDKVILIANGDLTVHKDNQELVKKLSESLKIEATDNN